MLHVEERTECVAFLLVHEFGGTNLGFNIRRGDFRRGFVRGIIPRTGTDSVNSKSLIQLADDKFKPDHRGLWVAGLNFLNPVRAFNAYLRSRFHQRPAVQYHLWVVGVIRHRRAYLHFHRINQAICHLTAELLQRRQLD